MTNVTDEARIRVLKKHIIYIKELAKPTADDIMHSANETCRLAKDWEHYGIVVEFPGFVIPSLDARHAVSKGVAMIRRKLIGVAIVSRKNLFLEVACMFIYRFARFPEISIHETQEAAIAHLEKLSLKRQQTSASMEMR